MPSLEIIWTVLHRCRLLPCAGTFQAPARNAEKKRLCDQWKNAHPLILKLTNPRFHYKWKCSCSAETLHWYLPLTGMKIGSENGSLKDQQMEIKCYGNASRARPGTSTQAVSLDLDWGVPVPDEKQKKSSLCMVRCTHRIYFCTRNWHLTGRNTGKMRNKNGAL
jgi:hypothetical protein